MPENIKELLAQEETAVKAASRYLATIPAAAYLNVSVSWLTKSRMDGSGPVHRKFGASVRYAVEDLDRRGDEQRVSGEVV